jgi:excisionase family DNA binding protein
MPENKLLKVEHVAEMLDMHPETIRRMVRAREIPHLRIRGQIRIRAAALEVYLRKKEIAA